LSFWDRDAICPEAAFRLRIASTRERSEPSFNEADGGYLVLTVEDRHLADAERALTSRFGLLTLSLASAPSGSGPGTCSAARTGGKTVEIPVPPKYGREDFLKGSYWSHRGKLDVPKEEFVLYPGAERDIDPGQGEQFASAVSIGEMYRGAFRSSERERHLRNIDEQVLPRLTVLPFDTPAARIYGEIHAELAAAGRPVADADLQIAATAIRFDLELVTGNLRHFSRIPRLVTSDVFAQCRAG